MFAGPSTLPERLRLKCPSTAFAVMTWAAVGVMIQCFTFAATAGAPSPGRFICNNTFRLPDGDERAYLRIPGPAPTPKGLGRVEVLSMSGALLSSVKDGTGNPLVADGLFHLGILEVPGTQPGDSAEIIIRAWDASQGATYHSSICPQTRQSVVLRIGPLGGGSLPIPSLGAISDFRGISGLWEPTPCPAGPFRLVSIVPVETWALRIEGFGWGTYALWSSTNLVNWTDTGNWSRASGPADSCFFIVDTRPLSDGGSVHYFKVEPKP